MSKRRDNVERVMRICFCIRCDRYVGEADFSRSTLMSIAERHWKDYGKNHGIWFEAATDPKSRQEGRRAFDPSRADDHREEYLRGGLR